MGGHGAETAHLTLPSGQQSITEAKILATAEKHPRWTAKGGSHPGRDKFSIYFSIVAKPSKFWSDSFPSSFSYLWEFSFRARKSLRFVILARDDDVIRPGLGGIEDSPLDPIPSEMPSRLRRDVLVSPKRLSFSLMLWNEKDRYCPSALTLASKKD